MSRHRFVALIVALVLPLALAFLLASGLIEASPTALSTIPPTTLAYQQAVVNNRLPISTPTLSVYYGVHVPGWLDKLCALITFENDAKKKVSLVMWYQGWGLTDGTQYFQTSWMNNIRNHGSIPMVSWEPWLYSDPAKTNQPQYRLSEIITGTTFYTYVKRWADDSKAWGHPYFLRFAAEMNGNWFPWSEQVNGNKPGEYVLAWRRVHDIFATEGITNVTWVWSPNVEYSGSIPLEGLYPGDDYVDWVGIDGYNWGTVPHPDVTGWKTFSEIFTQTYTHITELSTKPLMVAETASTEQGGSKADWITDAYSTQIPINFERIKAIIWFNEDKETDWRIESLPAARDAFAAAIQSSFYATNQYSSLSISPIPIPSLAIPMPPLKGRESCIYLPLASK